MKHSKFKLDGEFIKLESLLKCNGLVSTGGQAKVFIQNSEVYVNNEICMQRGKKLRKGDIVKMFDDEIEIC
ncbi:MAG: RNA-binding S4 domain-containing protein [Acutalibacteraceae bacterium]